MAIGLGPPAVTSPLRSPSPEELEKRDESKRPNWEAALEVDTTLLDPERAPDARRFRVRWK
jgi:hypothetical protein